MFRHKCTATTAAMTSIKIVLIVVVLLVLVSAVMYSFFLAPLRTNSSLVSGSNCKNGCFISEPVVDVLIPSLATIHGFNGATNHVLNVTRGQTVSMIVEVYTSNVGVNATMQLLIYPPPGGSNSSSGTTSSNTTTSSLLIGKMGGAAISAEFSPVNLSITADNNASSVMTLSVSSTAVEGYYDATVSATDPSNPSYVWGTFFEINVQASYADRTTSNLSFRHNRGLNLLSVREFVTTVTEDIAMATPARMGLSRTPIRMYNSPAATGINPTL